MLQPDVDAMAAEVVSLVKAALAPVQQQVAAQAAQIAVLSQRAPDDSLTRELGTLRERVAVVETKAPPEVPAPVDLEPVLTRIVALEAKSHHVDIAPDDIAASVAGLLRKELADLEIPAARITTRTVRDSQGAVKYQIEETS